MYSSLLPISGRNGYELTRTGGTQGFTSAQSHKDLLFCLREDNKLLPNKAGACLIIPNIKSYYIFYRKRGIKDSRDDPIAVTEYAPPSLGGSLRVNPNIIDRWPIIGEFAYVKMLATNILVSANKTLRAKSKPPVAVGPISHERNNIKYAQMFFGPAKKLQSNVRCIHYSEQYVNDC